MARQVRVLPVPSWPNLCSTVSLCGIPVASTSVWKEGFLSLLIRQVIYGHRPSIPGRLPPILPIIFWNLPIFFIICCI
jgi:hypothetical protein